MRHYVENCIKQITRYARNLYNKLRGKKIMDLPVKDGKINKDEVSMVLVFSVAGKKYFFCLVSNCECWLYWTPELEQWFSLSGIYVLQITGEPEVKCNPEDVRNTPNPHDFSSPVKAEIKL